MNGCHSLMITRQMSTEASNGFADFDEIHFTKTILNVDLNIEHWCGKLQLNKPSHIVNYTGEATPYSPQNKK